MDLTIIVFLSIYQYKCVSCLCYKLPYYTTFSPKFIQIGDWRRGSGDT